MIVGTTINHPGDTTPYYSPSFPRGGEAANFSLDVTHLVGTLTFDVDVEHKNMEDTTWSSAGTFTGITATGVSVKDITGLKEEIRIKSSFSTGSAGDFVHVVVAEPAWRPY